MGGILRRLTNDDFAGWHPSWSPDGKHIAFTSSRAKKYERWELANPRDGHRWGKSAKSL